MSTLVPFFSLLTAAFLLSSCSVAIEPIEPFKLVVPKLPSDVVPLTQHTAATLLEQECPQGVTVIDDGRIDCTDRYLDGNGLQWAFSVVHGHFLSPTSEDALVDGWGGEMHPQLYGGSLLLTKKGGTWRRVWYQSGLRTRHCSRVTLESGRDLLVCEEEYGMMGTIDHLLYTIDALSPEQCRDSKVLVATSCEGVCTCSETRIQSIDKIELHRRPQEGQVGMSVQVRSGRHVLTASEQEACNAGKEIEPPPTKTDTIDFVLHGASFQPAAWSSEAVKPFN